MIQNSIKQTNEFGNKINEQKGKVEALHKNKTVSEKFNI